MAPLALRRDGRGRLPAPQQFGSEAETDLGGSDSGWQPRAGPSLAVLALAAVPQQASTPTASSRVDDAIPELSGDLSGTIADGGSGIVSIRGTVSSAAIFRIDLLANDGRVTDSALQMLFAGGATCEGTLSALDERGFTGTCTLSGGEARTVHAEWTVSQGMVAGSISTTPASAET